MAESAKLTPVQGPSPLVRIRALSPSQLPAHPALNNQDVTSTTTQPELAEFIEAILTQAVHFIDTEHDATFRAHGTKSSPPSTSTVELFARDIPASELPPAPAAAPAAAKNGSASASPPPSSSAPQPQQGQQPRRFSISSNNEAWFSRKSLHVPKAEAGTATLEEFETGLLIGHSKNEAAYTPEVYDAREVLNWSEELAKLDGKVGSYEGVMMEVYEMAHHIPPPLTNRVFPVLLVGAKTSLQGFILVQVPIDLSTCSSAFYTSGRHRKEGESDQQRKKITLARYVSVERVVLLEKENQEESRIKWVMATASDAGGNLPMAVQKLAVPGQIAKDVGWFLKWTAEQRQEGS